MIIAAGSAITRRCCSRRRLRSEGAVRHGLAAQGWHRVPVEHAVIDGEDRFLILHNDNAVNFTLVEAPVTDPSDQRTLIEHRDDVRLGRGRRLRRPSVVSYRREALRGSSQADQQRLWHARGIHVRHGADSGRSRWQPELGFAAAAQGTTSFVS